MEYLTSRQLDTNSMAASAPMLDDLIKEYLIFRGFTNTLKSFESDLKSDKDKSFRVCSFHSLSFLRTSNVLDRGYKNNSFKKAVCYIGGVIMMIMRLT